MSTTQLLPYSSGGGAIRDSASSPPPPPYSRLSPSSKALSFLGLLPTTVLSVVLLAGAQLEWKTSGSFYHLISGQRATVQIIIQILSNLLGLVYVTTVCQLINYRTRISLRRHPISLDVLRLWNGFSTSIVRWELPFKLLLPLVLFVVAAALPSALWAGALTPLNTSANSTTFLDVPRYTNITGFQSEKNTFAIQNSKGLFTYDVGFQFIADLLQSASSATTTNNAPRSHAKLDNSRYFYHGRSYRMGASVGLDDEHISNDNLVLGYTYIDLGFDTTMTCIYNYTSDFKIVAVQDTSTEFAAVGLLPDSGDSQELSYYLGHDSSQIVAIGVAHDLPGPVEFLPRYLGVAAGDAYQNLNQVQCVATFTPAQFVVSASVVGKNITVTSTISQSRIENIEPSGNLTHEATRQIALMSQDETNLYRSTVGGSFESSISDYKTSLPASSSMTEQEIALAAVTNSITAMLDDILVAYSSAQLIIANDTTRLTATVERQAIMFGQHKYIVGVFVLNLIVLLLVGLEFARTRFWRSLTPFDYTDPSCLVVGSNGLNSQDKSIRVKIEEGFHGQHRLVWNV